MVNNMDKTIKECINYLHDHDLLSECNYAALVNTLDECYEKADRLDNCKSAYLIGELVYVEKDLYDKKDKNHIALIEIESISYDKNTGSYLYNYLYTEDELFPTEDDLIVFLRSKYYQEYEDKIIKVVNDVKKLKEGSDIYAKR